MIRHVQFYLAAVVLCAGIALAQSNAQAPSSDPASQAQPAATHDDAGRPITTEPTALAAPAPAPPDQRQAFQDNVKDIYFDFNQAELRPEDRATLAHNADWLKSHSDVAFTIEGDADERGSIVYNLFLSDLRALAARDALVQMGVPSNQIVTATGWGKLYPVCNQSDESCWSQNRRSHLAAWPAERSPQTSAHSIPGDLQSGFTAALGR